MAWADNESTLYGNALLSVVTVGCIFWQFALFASDLSLSLLVKKLYFNQPPLELVPCRNANFALFTICASQLFHVTWPWFRSDARRDKVV